MTKKYTRTVKAALAETGGKFALAGALALDIPKAQGKDGVRVKLIEARTAIIDAGGEERSVATLEKYRWVALHFLPNGGKAGWVDGYSFTAHREAYDNGISAVEFQGNPRTATELRQQYGKQTNGFVPTADDVAKMTSEQKDKLAEAVASDTETTGKVAAKMPQSPRGVSSAGENEGALLGTLSAMEAMDNYAGLTMQLADAFAAVAPFIRSGTIPLAEELLQGWKDRLALEIMTIDQLKADILETS